MVGTEGLSFFVIARSDLMECEVDTLTVDSR